MIEGDKLTRLLLLSMPMALSALARLAVGLASLGPLPFLDTERPGPSGRGRDLLLLSRCRCAHDLPPSFVFCPLLLLHRSSLPSVRRSRGRRRRDGTAHLSRSLSSSRSKGSDDLDRRRDRRCW